MVRPRTHERRARTGARCHRRALASDRRGPAGTTGEDPWYLQRTAPDLTCSLSCRHAPELCPAHRGEDLEPIMATTDAKTGIRLPWGSNRSTSPERANEEPADGAEVDNPWPVTDTAQGEPAAESAAEPAGQSEPSSEEQVSAVTSVPTSARKPAAKPTKFLADLTKAMQVAAESAREQTLTQFQADAKTFVELIHERSATENTSLRAQADEDIAGIRDWSKAEIAGSARRPIARSARERPISRKSSRPMRRGSSARSSTSTCRSAASSARWRRSSRSSSKSRIRPASRRWPRRSRSRRPSRTSCPRPSRRRWPRPPRRSKPARRRRDRRRRRGGHRGRDHGGPGTGRSVDRCDGRARGPRRAPGRRADG